MVVFIIVNSVLTVHIIWRNGGRKNASNCTDLYVTIQNFRKVGLAPPHIGEGLQCPFPKPTPSALPRCAPPAPCSGLNRPLQCLLLLAVDVTGHDQFRSPSFGAR